jgi:hypothetical protein
VSIHLSSSESNVRRAVLSCDAPGCPAQVEPPPAERWRSDADARSFARAHAAGWTVDVHAQTDYCPGHAERNATRAAEATVPRPTATVRDQAGQPLDRDEYAEHLRSLLTVDPKSTIDIWQATPAQIAVVAALLTELAGVYRGEKLGTLAHEIVVLLDRQLLNQG